LTSEGFVNPSALKAGDTIQEVSGNSNLYKMVSSVTGTLNRVTYGTQNKVNIGGTNLVYLNDATDDGTEIAKKLYDESYDSGTGVTIDDVYGNEVTYLLNKNNTVSAIIVGETSTGTKLYGIFVDTDTNSTSVAGGQASTITIFTSEGKTVKYDINKDDRTTVNTQLAVDGSNKTAQLGRLIEYKVNKSGAVTKVTFVGTAAGETGADVIGNSMSNAPGVEIEVVNNSVLKANNVSYTLASNAIIFEVNDDNGDVDADIVTKSAVLSGGDFTPGNITLTGNSNASGFTYAYMVPTVTGGNTIKVLAYTNSQSTKYHYGVVDAYNFAGADYDNSITFNGDDTVYELDQTGLSGVGAAAGSFVVYTKSGDTVTLVRAYKEKADFKTGAYAKLVNSVSSGLIDFDANITNVIDQEHSSTSASVGSVITNDSTLVYVLDAGTGKFVEGTADSIVKNGYVYVPVLDDDGYAEVVLVDEYNQY
jgi:hypothetical protein